VPANRRAQPPITGSAAASVTNGGAIAQRVQVTTSFRVQVAICLVGGAGLLLVVLGSFLPWVISGNVRRSSYQIIGVVGRLGIGDGGALAVLIGAWPFIGVLCVVPALAAAIRWWRTSAVLAILIGLISGVLSFGLLIFVAGRGGAILRLAPIGPSVMAAGAVILVCVGAGLFLLTDSPVRRTGDSTIRQRSAMMDPGGATK